MTESAGSLTPARVAECRRQFPALARQFEGRPVVYFDGPAGTQVPRRVVDAISDYLAHRNANHGGRFATSRESDAMLGEAHRAAADLFGAADPDCVAFGPNMTTLAFAVSRALARTWRPGDEVLVTRLDHDANVTPWVLAARDAGITVKHVDFRRHDCTLDLDDFQEKLTPRTRLVAVGCASNATGGIGPAAEICRRAHAHKAMVFVDAVHYAPHALMDVAAWGCDLAVCSAYKFFGPHIGLLWGRRELLEALPAYKVRPAANDLPGKWMTGTQNHECLAGVLAAIEYLADLGRSLSGRNDAPRREALKAAFAAIVAYERKLARRLLEGLARLAEIKVWGIADPARLNERVPTVSLTHRRLEPAQLAEHLDRRGIYAWHGNYYALALSEALGLEPQGMLRIGLVHYNTEEEIDRLLDALAAV